MFASRARLFGVLAIGCALGAAVLATPAAADDATPGYGCAVETPNQGAPASLQPLRVCASFDRTAYKSSDQVKLTVSVTNLGSATAPGVHMDETGSQYRDWTGLPSGPLFTSGLDLPAGATVVSSGLGYAADPAAGVVAFISSVYESVSPGSGIGIGSPFTISSPVTAVTDNYDGVVFTDTNGNGQPDSGEGLAGTQISLSGPFNGVNGQFSQTYNATTDADGNFQLANLPGGVYSEQVTAPNGLVVRGPRNGEVTVDGTAADHGVRYPATKPLSDTLSGTIAFDKPAYQVGDPAQLTIKLSNSGTTDLTGIQATCNPAGDEGSIWTSGSGWGALTGAGVSVPAGQTITLTVPTVIPVNTEGTVYAGCVFGPDIASFAPDYPYLDASASVSPATDPGPNFTVAYADDDPLGGQVLVPVRLLDPATGADALFMFEPGAVSGLPAGTYDIAVDSGWTLAPGQAGTLDTANVTDGQTVTIHVVPADPQPAPPTPPTD